MTHPDLSLHAQGLLQPHISAAEGFVENHSQLRIPSRFRWEAGWTRYSPLGESQGAVPHPLESAYVFDCETFVRGGNHPVMATAASAQALYVWLSPELWGGSGNPTPLVPLGRSQAFIVAHNASFDRARVEEEYWPLGDVPDRYWFCTLSATLAVAGCASRQQSMLEAMEKPWKWLTREEREFRREPPIWSSFACKRFRLIDCYNHLVAKPSGKPLLTDEDKTIRDAFCVARSAPELRREDLVEYALRDVLYTAELFRAVWPLFRRATPTWIGLSSQYHQHRSRLPLSPSWSRWVAQVDTKYHELTEEASRVLRTATEEAVGPWQQKLRADIAQVTSQLPDICREWDIRVTAKSTPRALIRKLLKAGKPMAELLPATCLHEQSLDVWLRQLDWTPIFGGQMADLPEWASKYMIGRTNLTLKTQIAGLILRCRWMGSPVLFDREHGYRYVDPQTSELLRVPHPDNGDGNVTNLFAKGFVSKPALSSSNPHAKRILEIGISVANWAQARVNIVGDLDRPGGPKTPPFMRGTMVIPDVNAVGTITRRTSSKVWTVMPGDIDPQKIGTERRSRVEAPPGFSLVGADFDRQELHIASILSDLENNGEQTPFTHDVLFGDPYQSMADKIGIKRSPAKAALLAMMYGSGVKGIVDQIRADYPDKPIAELRTIAEASLRYLKGDEVRGQYVGGAASAYFNRVSRIASQAVPATPALRTQISRAMCNYGSPLDRPSRKYDRPPVRTQANWVIQCSGSDILAILLNAVSTHSTVPYEFVLSIHDEAWFQVRSADAIEFACCLQRAHRATWQFFHAAVGLPDCPPERFYFSGVSIDQRIRKSPTASTTTLSHDGTAEPDGREWTAEELHTWAIANGHEGL